MADSVKCHKCRKDLTSRNRLITENCGHSKCRQCLISEENGCDECKHNTPPPIKSSSIEEPTYIEQNHNLSPVDAIEPSSEKTKSGRISFPSHIVKECMDKKTVYLCTICNKRFKSRTQQYYHLFCNNSSNKPFKCEQCQKTFSTSSHLKYHMDGHSQKSFPCSICNKTFSKLQILRKHEKLHTAKAEECPECGVKLRNKVAFAAHLQRHQNIFPYTCDVCEKKFSLKSTLRLHQTVHSGGKQFKCDLCDKKFDRNSTLKLHSLRHSKQKKFHCSECFKHFIDTKSLLRHSQIHLGKSKYKCSLCDTTSIRKDNITRHIRNMHPEHDKNSIEIIIETLSEKVIEGVSILQPSATIPAENTNLNDIPKTVANSSVIRCIGNVQPVIIPQDNQTQVNPQTKEKEEQVAVHTAATTHKKLKKKYDPCEMYRKILLDDDSIQETDTNNPTDVTSTAKLASETTGNGQQSNFSETHWRKNFKYFQPFD